MSAVKTGRSASFLKALGEKVLLGDGAMGTLLYARGVALDACFEHLNLVQPELVRQVHADYLAAGSEVIESNTFAANGVRLGAIGLAGKVAAINRAGARLAREVAGETRFIAGAVGPLSTPRGEGEPLTAAEKRRLFIEQMEALAQEGVDLFLLETFSRLDELELATCIATELGLPAVAQMAFLEEGRSRDGVSAEEAATRLTVAGAAVIGANCGSGPRDLLRILRRMREVTDRPLSAFANSGFPQYVDGRYIYLATPDYFATMAQEMVLAGARLVGGCCGTTPEHISALAKGVRQSAEETLPSSVTATAPVVRRVVAETPVPPAHFLEAWGERPLVTVELDPPRGLDCSKVMAGAKQLAAAGVDAISLAENPLARIRMGNIALARQIQEETGTEVIVHVTGRDRNLIGLHSEMMGAHLLGLRTILAVTGDPVAVGGEAGASSVFDLNSIGLLELLSALNRGENLLGADLGGTTSFFCGAAFNPNLPRIDGQLQRLEKKIAAGARFVQTQPIYDVEILDRLLEKTSPYNIPVLVGLLPLVSGRNAEFLHNEVPGITLPEPVRQRMASTSGEEGVRQGMMLARELLAAGRGRVGGWYLMPPFGKVELALDLLATIRAEG
ncbi:MAG: bifunctional homocysteine S-methyltransferase/methylenetetrahydrofolate reductase [Desulfuromonas sp.]|nr:MAG: bifunctional homocysteine S-methyltransferase/methylenetetrahydrofolate reductase [Desulfuromonas sp.]